LAVIADALVAARSRAWAPRALAAAAVLAVSVTALRAIGNDRAQLDAFGRAYAAFIARHAGPSARIVVATKGYRDGWEGGPRAGRRGGAAGRAVPLRSQRDAGGRRGHRGARGGGPGRPADCAWPFQAFIVERL